MTTGACSELVQLMLAEKRSAATRSAYRQALTHFFGGSPTDALVGNLLALSREGLTERLTRYKARMLASGAAEATVNQRLTAVLGLLRLAYKTGKTLVEPQDLVTFERVRNYRDTRGVDLPTLTRLVDSPGVDDLAGIRDRAILRILAENALRRGELAGLEVADAQLDGKPPRLWVLGKGHGSQKEPITITPVCAQAIRAYLLASGHEDGRLFRNLARNGYRGGGLTGRGIWEIVKNRGAELGIERLAPHKLRHSAITAALDLTDGNVRKVQKLSRHSDIRTLLKYDDARDDMQGELTGLLSAALGKGG